MRGRPLPAPVTGVNTERPIPLDTDYASVYGSHMRKTFVKCSTHGRVRAAVKSETVYHMNNFSGFRWTDEKTVVVKTPSGHAKCSVCNQPNPAIVIDGQHSETTACDERCTTATGNKCECSCEGDNHGEQS